MDLFGDFVDHHCHGVVTAALERPRLEALMSEAHRPASPYFGSQFDKPLGLMVRRFCAPVLGLEPLAPAADYAARRLALGPDEVNRRLLRAAGVAEMLIDTGHRAAEIADPEAMAALSDARAREIVRIEAVMEAAARGAGSAAEALDAFDAALAERAAGAAGLKSIVAYRASFALDQSAPSRAAALAAMGGWLGEGAAEGLSRLSDPTLLRHALFTGLELCAARRLPLQLHVGFGDRDIAMPRCDPTVFAPFIEAAEAREVPVTLLHCYPFERDAAWLAEVYSNVFLDVGAVLNFTGPSARRVLADAMEMAPFSKHLYSSDAFGLAELHLLGRIQFERAFRAITDGWIAAGDATAADVERLARAVAHGNARRIYPDAATAP
jgi:predicted TIM-barrel fold metal-dependent hydrolase